MSSRNLPDPDKWVASKKVERPLTQRPIVDPRFRAHCGISTPPSSTKRKAARSKPYPSSASTSRPKHSVVDVTPTAPQRSIASFFTPPTTGPNLKSKAKGKSTTQPGIENSPLALDAHVFPSSLPRSRRTRKLSPTRPKVLLRTPPPPPSSQYQITQVPDGVLANHRKLCGQDDERPVAPSLWRREAGLVDTQEDLEYAKTARRYEEDRTTDERAAKRKRIDEHALEVVGAQAVERARQARERRHLGEFKSLAHLSSSTGSSSPRRDRESSPSERTRLSHKTGHRLTRHSSAIDGPVAERDAKWPKSNRSALPAIPRHSQKTSQSISPRVTPQKRSSPAATEIPSPVTPRRRSLHHKVTPPKSRTPQKYDNQQETLFVFPDPPSQPVFEPVTRQRSISDWQPVDMDPETLMTWSMGGGVVSLGMIEEAASEAEPIEADYGTDDIEAEYGDENVEAGVGDDDDCESIAASVASQVFPCLVESFSPTRRATIQRRAPTSTLLLADFDARSPSLRPRSYQPDPLDFHLTCSPEAPSKQRSNETIPSSIPVESDSTPPLPSPSPKKLVRRADQEFKRVGLFSSLSDGHAVQPSASAATPGSAGSKSTQSRSIRAAHSSRAGRSSQSNQSKLEAFGYFAANASRREERDFDKSFSDEEDLDFGDEQPLFASPTKQGRLAPVPEAPPHPSLQPAGVRELARRESEAMARHHEQSRSGRSNHTDTDFEIPSASSDWAVPEPSTDTSSDGLDAPRISHSTREWWDRLDESGSM